MGAQGSGFVSEGKMSFDTLHILLDVATRIDRQLQLHQPNAGFKQPGPEIVSACLREAIRNADREPDVRAEDAVLEEVSHVRRQQHGKHEQDRQDAEQWLEKWEPLVRELRARSKS